MKYKPIVIGIAGTKHSGKDTVASMIDYIIREGVAKADYYKWKSLEFVKYSPNIIYFADALKDICSAVFNITRAAFNDSDIKDNHVWCFTEERFLDINLLDKTKYGIITIEDLALNDMNLSETRLWFNKKGLVSCITLRTIMQFIGTELFRNKVSNSTWVDICINKAIDCSDNGHCIIPDVRFYNEAEAIRNIKDRKSFIIKLIRKTNYTDNHESEEIDFDGNYNIENNDSKMTLFYKILKILTLELK